MGALLVHAIKREGVEFNLCSLGVKDKFGQSAYLALHLYEKHGVSAKAISEAAIKLVNS